jgi:anti-anti-sigma regulatory factor
MAARKKKTPLLDGEQETVTTGLEAESSQEQLIINDNDINVEGNDMNTSEDTPEEPVADEAAIAVEPIITLDANLSIQNVVKLYERMKASYTAFNGLEINASQVAAIDTTTLQVLVALKKDADKNEREVTFTSPSPRFIESAKLLGLLDVLGINE